MLADSEVPVDADFQMRLCLLIPKQFADADSEAGVLADSEALVDADQDAFVLAGILTHLLMLI